MSNSQIKAVFYDLDNTLYPKIIDVEQRIVKCVKKFFPERENEVINFWIKEWMENGPKKPLVNIIVDKFNPTLDVKEIVDFYRKCKTILKFDKTVKDVLSKIKNKGIKQFLITNGRLSVQKYKIKKLGLINFMDEIIITGGRYVKPSPYYFLKLIHRHNLSPDECISVGDWYKIDGLASIRAGITFIYVQGGPIKEDIPPKIRRIVSLGELLEILEI